MKLGKFVTLEGAETIDPRTNFFYSHTYIFNFGIPFNHTGALATFHATKWLDPDGRRYARREHQHRRQQRLVCFSRRDRTQLHRGQTDVVAASPTSVLKRRTTITISVISTDITTTWKITDKLTSITDLNYAHDDGADADAYGIAQYFTYAINSWLTAGIRGEIFGMTRAFMWSRLPTPMTRCALWKGQPTIDPRTVGGGKTTYGAITAGVNIKPPMPKPLAGLAIRPEIRYDRSLNDTRPFNDSSDRDQFTAGIDFIVTF